MLVIRGQKGYLVFLCCTVSGHNGTLSEVQKNTVALLKAHFRNMYHEPNEGYESLLITVMLNSLACHHRHRTEQMNVREANLNSQPPPTQKNRGTLHKDECELGEQMVVMMAFFVWQNNLISRSTYTNFFWSYQPHLMGFCSIVIMWLNYGTARTLNKRLNEHRKQFSAVSEHLTKTWSQHRLGIRDNRTFTFDAREHLWTTCFNTIEIPYSGHVMIPPWQLKLKS